MIRKVERYPGLKEAKNSFEDKMSLNVTSVMDYLAIYSKLNEVGVRLDAFNKIKEEDKFSLDEIQSTLKMIEVDEEAISSIPLVSKCFGCFKIDTTMLRIDLQRAAKQTFPKIQTKLANISRIAIGELTGEIEKMKEKLSIDKEDLHSCISIIEGAHDLKAKSRNLLDVLIVAQSIYNEYYIKKTNCKDVPEQLSNIKRSLEYVFLIT